ncbi:MAG: hypothetical protein KAQ85_04670, partial [Thermodesulfovibrionia bacterium]|nr:hypothetical protein [Thermodesulfovibrionia bacterium]
THKWLFDNKSVPKAFYNRPELKILKKPTDKLKMGYEEKLPSQNEFYDIWEMTGTKFYEDMKRYKSSGVWNKDKNVSLGALTTGGRTRMQQKVADYWNEAKSQARLYKVTWDDFKKNNTSVYDEVYNRGAMPRPITSVDIPKLMEDGDVYKDENGKIVIESTQKLPMEAVAKLNADAFPLFINRISSIPRNKRMSASDSRYKALINQIWKDAVAMSEYEYVKKYLDIK